MKEMYLMQDLELDAPVASFIRRGSQARTGSLYGNHKTEMWQIRARQCCFSERSRTRNRAGKFQNPQRVTQDESRDGEKLCAEIRMFLPAGVKTHGLPPASKYP